MPLKLLARKGLWNESLLLDGGSYIYEGIPSFAEGVLESLYQSLMCTLLRIQQYHSVQSAKTYVAYARGEVSSLFVFQIQKNAIVVHNQQIVIDPVELERFSRRVFSQYPEVSRLSFYAVGAELSDFPLVYHAVDCLEDIFLRLPNSLPEYLRSLGRKTSETLRRAEKKLLRDHPSFRMVFLSNDEVCDHHVCAILDLNRLRMDAKGLVSRHTDESNYKLMALVRRYGLVGIALIDDKICGGVIQLRVGSHWFSHTISHHPEFDSYRLGQLCNYYGIGATIEKGGGTFHFGWGRSEHKYRLGARNRDLIKLEVYRSFGAFVADIFGVFHRAALSKRRKVKLWIAEHENVDNSFAASAIRNAKKIRSVASAAVEKFRP